MEELKNDIKKLIVESLNLEDIEPEEIGDHMLLFSESGLGLDSIDALELGVALRKKYSLRIESGDPENREHFATVSNLAKFIQASATN